MRTKKTKLVSTGATLALSLPLTLFAQESPPTGSPPVESPKSLDRITVEEEQDEVPYTVPETEAATKLTLSLRDTPQSVTVFTRDRLEDQNLLSIREVLDSTPGVYSFQWDTERVIFSARGFVIDNLLYDGLPATTNFGTDSIDDTLDTALYDRIEIVRGATGLMTGAGSPSASVNVVRKHATSESLDVRLGVQAGSWDDRRVDVDVSTALNSSGTVRARFVGAYQDRESYQDLYRLKKSVFYGIVDADVTSSTRVSLGFDYLDNDPRGNTWGSFPMFLGNGEPTDWDRSVTTSTDWAFWERRTRTVFGEVNHDFGNDWSMRATLSYRKFDEDMALFYMFGFPDPVTGTGLDPFAYRSTSEVTEKALDVYAKGLFGLFGREHELVIGYNGSRMDNLGDEREPGDSADTGNFFEWDGSYPEPTFGEALQVTNVNTKQDALYVATRLSVTDPLKVIAGLRVSKFDTDYYYLYDTPEGGFQYDFDKTLPYAGVIFDISRDFSAFASYTEIFKPQNAKDETNRFLDPTDGESFELGLKGAHFDDRLSTALTVFETRQNNVPGPVFNEDGSPVFLDDGTQASQAIDGTRTHGFELEAAGEIREGWNLSLGWTKFSLKAGEGEDVRSFVPRTMVRAFTSWNVPGLSRKLTLGGGVNWQAASHTEVADPSGGRQTLRQGSLALVSLMARYELAPGMTVQVNGKNLLDKKYFVLDNYDNTYFGAPLNVAASFNWNF